MTYSVKEIFYTLQGEGRRAGRPAVFCRFSGCNLWTGLERDRASAVCRFCDTDFRGTDGTLGGRFADAEKLAEVVASQWPSAAGRPYVVLTGGEPLLQVDGPLIDALHAREFEIAVETNGTIVAPEGIDWLCVSPKAGASWVQRRGHELKLVFPQKGLLPSDVNDVHFDYLLLQPMDNLERARNTREAIAFCQTHPEWWLSVQTHKVLGIR